MTRICAWRISAVGIYVHGYDKIHKARVTEVATLVVGRSDHGERPSCDRSGKMPDCSVHEEQQKKASQVLVAA